VNCNEKNALSPSERKVVDPIFKDKEEPTDTSLDNDDDDDELDTTTEVFVEYDVLVEECSAGIGRRENPTSYEPTIDLQLAEQELGAGPMRFSRKGERSLQEQLESLSEPNRQTYEHLAKKWNDRARGGGRFPLTYEWILRFARNNCSYSKTNTGHNIVFQERKAWKAMRKFKKRFSKLTIAGELEDQLRTKTLFHVPGLKTAVGHDMFYMKPSRYFPKETSTRTLINNLAYVMTQRHWLCRQYGRLGHEEF
jgi:hypothetical protein